MSKITQEKLNQFKNKYEKGKYGIPKWVMFCEIMLKNNFNVFLYRSKSTVSKYVTISKNNKSLKIRFSNHKANKIKEKNYESDIYVGVGNSGVITTEQVIKIILEADWS